ncbi:MAG TPA: ABC transporter permease [Deltaproteobacteria bacterium]|nr:ABC transporter permease [Deltaproteobacteria bacterium]
MRAYIIKRLIQIIPTLLGITLITFVIIQLAPGNPAVFKVKMATQGQVASDAVSKQIIEQTKKLYGLDKPLPVQYLLWLKRVVTFDFGNSYKDHRPVMDKILERLPITIQLNVISLCTLFSLSILFPEKRSER